MACAETNVENGVPLIKRHCLSDSEFVVFRNGMNARSAVGSYRPRNRHESFFAYFFVGTKKYESGEYSLSEIKIIIETLKILIFINSESSPE